ncbi:unannotated protein [freshwater metagenome]|jgi:hypothetical protein|uniref:Unannotated protein n=1 Tax=freshwater metagenome TaxID=449393 RepID=A0A6J7KTP5_9ZZZZ
MALASTRFRYGVNNQNPFAIIKEFDRPEYSSIGGREYFECAGSESHAAGAGEFVCIDYPATHEPLD